MKESIKKIDKWVVIRTVVLVLALTNQLLVAFGKSPIPIDDAIVEQAVTVAWTIISALLAFWYNNNFTGNAIQAQEVLNYLKETSKEDNQGIEEDVL